MSFYFIANNFHFTLELIGALAFFVMAWLSIDSYLIDKKYSLLFRFLGFSFMGIWQIIYAFNLTSDIINFTGFFIYLLGIIFTIFSFSSAPQLATLYSIILIPSFTSLETFLQGIATILLGILSFFIYSQAKREFNNMLKPLWLGFTFLTFGALFQTAISSDNQYGVFWYFSKACEILGFFSFAFWGWQYLRLRIKESMVLIFITMTMFISAIVTLAFSTILVNKIEKETRNNLLTNAKVFDFSVKALISQSRAEATLVSMDEDVVNNISNSPQLQSVLTSYLDSEKLGFLLVTDKNGVVLMRAHSPLQHGDSIASERAVEEALIGNTFSTVEFSPIEKFSIRSSSPIYKNGKMIGVVVAGFPLDNAMIDGLKKITGLDATLYQKDTAIATTTLALDGRSRLTGITIIDNNIKNSVLVKGESATTRVLIKDTPYLASYIPLKNGDNNIIGVFSAVKPQVDIMEIANATNRLTFVTVTLLLLVLAFPIYLITKRLLGNI